MHAEPGGEEEEPAASTDPAHAWLAAAIIFLLIAFLMKRRSHDHAEGDTPIRISRDRPRQLGRSGFPRSLGRDDPTSRIRRFSGRHRTDSGNSRGNMH